MDSRCIRNPLYQPACDLAMSELFSAMNRAPTPVFTHMSANRACRLLTRVAVAHVRACLVDAHRGMLHGRGYRLC